MIGYFFKKLFNLFPCLSWNICSTKLNFGVSSLIWALLGVVLFSIFGKAIALNFSAFPSSLSTKQQFILSQNPAHLSISLSSQFPPPQVHPLPSFLEQWNNQEGDYFDQIQPTTLGYLVWSKFPIAVYIDPSSNLTDSSASTIRAQNWYIAVSQAVEEWNQVIPLKEVQERELADILIERSRPPLEVTRHPETGEFEFPRARAAQTQYQFYLSDDNPQILSHRFIIYLSPHQNKVYTLATARHELGHALGIWGHSPDKNDVLYFSQVSNPPTISPRDINTLKTIFQQPTRLGWPINLNSEH